MNVPVLVTTILKLFSINIEIIFHVRQTITWDRIIFICKNNVLSGLSVCQNIYSSWNKKESLMKGLKLF